MKKRYRRASEFIAALCLSFNAATAVAQGSAQHPCPDLSNPSYRRPQESCGAHLACRLVLAELKTCPRATGFLKALQARIGEGRSILFFGSNTNAKLMDVWNALSDLIPSEALKKKKWMVEIIGLDETSFNESDVVKGNDALTGAWTFWGKTSDGKPNGFGIHFEANPQGFRLMRGNFQGRTSLDVADLIKFDGTSLSRQLGRYESDRVKANVDTITISDTGLMMDGRFNTGLSIFQGVIQQPDKSRLSGTYHLQTGDGQLEVSRPDGTIKERGLYKNHQLYVGEKLDTKGTVLERVNLKIVDDEKEQMRLLNERKAQALEEQKRINLQAQQQEIAAREEQNLRDQIGIWHAGQLFAFADESIAERKDEKARLALRALIRRFPEHPLAAQAAAMLAKIPGPLDAERTNESSTAPLPLPYGASPTKMRCEDVLVQLEKEQQDTVAQNASPPPFAVYRQATQFARQRLHVLETKCPPSIKNQILKEQLQSAIQASENACRRLVVDESLCLASP